MPDSDAPSSQSILSDTHRERRFIEEYAMEPNAYRAAIRAGYEQEGARVIAIELLARPNIQMAVQEYRAAHVKWVEQKLHEVVAEMTGLAYIDIRDIVTWDESGKPRFVKSDDLPPHIARAVKSIKFKTHTTFSKDGDALADDTTIELTLHDKKSSLDSLMKHLGLFPTWSKNGQPNETQPPQDSPQFDWSLLPNEEWETLKRLCDLARIAKQDTPPTTHSPGGSS